MRASAGARRESRFLARGRAGDQPDPAHRRAVLPDPVPGAHHELQPARRAAPAVAAGAGRRAAGRAPAADPDHRRRRPLLHRQHRSAAQGRGHAEGGDRAGGRQRPHPAGGAARRRPHAAPVGDHGDGRAGPIGLHQTFDRDDPRAQDEMSTPSPAAWRTYRRLLGYASKYRWYLAAAAIGMVVEASCAGLFTRLMAPMVDETFVARNPAVRWSLPLALLGLFLLRGIATFVTDYGMARAGRSVVRDLRTGLLGKFLRLPSSRFDKEPVAMLVSRLNYDTEQVTQATSEAIKVVVTDTLTILALLAVMFWQSPRVTLAMLVVAPLIALISGYVGSRYRRINRGVQTGVASMAQAAEEVLAAQQEVKIYGAQASEEARYRELAEHNLRLNLKVESTRASASSVVQWLGAAALAVILLVAGNEAMLGRMSAGSFVSIMMAMMALIPSLKRITNVQSAVQRGISASERIFAVLDEPEEVDAGKLPLARAKGEIEFRNASVRYEGQPTAALDGISFRATPGTVTAIVGRSGSGKSTLIRLLPRFYEASE